MATLAYDFKIVGLSTVNRALSSLERRLAAHNRKVQKMVGGPARGGASGAAGMRTAANQQLAAQRSLNQKLIVEEQKTQGRLRQIRERARQQEMASVRRQAQAEARAQVRAQGRTARTRGNLAGSAMGVAGRSVRSTVRGVGALGGSLLSIGGGFAAANAIGVEKRLHGRAAALANQARGTEGGGGRSFADLKGQAMSVARTQGVKSGQGPEAVIDAMRQFQSISGRFDIAAKMAEYMTELSDATDAGLGDVGRTAGQVFQSVMAQMPEGANKAQDAMGATIKIMDAMAGQSKIGSIEMSDLAKEMGKLMSSTSSFKGDVSDLATQMGAIGQTAVAGGADKPAEAMTALMRFADDLTQRGSVAGGAYQKRGINVFNEEMIGGKKVKGSLKGPKALIMEIMRATKGDISILPKLQGARGRKALSPFAKLYREGEKAKPGSGLQAIEAKFAEFEKVSLSEGQRKAAASNTRKQAGRQFDIAMAKFNDAIGSQLLPVITRLVPRFVALIPSITKAAEAFGRFVEWFSKNPLEGLGALILGKVAADLAVAGIGEAIKAAILKLMGGGAGTPVPKVPVGTAGAAGAGLVGTGLAVAGAAVAVGAAGYNAYKLAGELGNSDARWDRKQEQNILDAQKRDIANNAKRSGHSLVRRDRSALEQLTDPGRWFDSNRSTEFIAPGGSKGFSTYATAKDAERANERPERIAYKSKPFEGAEPMKEAGNIQKQAGELMNSSAKVLATAVSDFSGIAGAIGDALNRGDAPGSPVGPR